MLRALILAALLAGCSPAPETAPPAKAPAAAPVAAPEPTPVPAPKAEAPPPPAAAVRAEMRTEAPPREAERYRRDLIANARVVWGLEAPIAALAAQVHQESSWRPDAQSRYAGGLAQFTPATAEWISQAYAGELGENQPFNPSWALRALARYDKHLYDAQRHFRTHCDRYAFALAAYNGGQGWVSKRQRLAEDPGRYDTTSRINPGIRPDNQAENENYPRRILIRWQPVYRSWGPGVDCVGLIT